MSTASSAAPVTVVVPTIGATELLATCLRAIRSCEPPADEILVVDQSGTDTVARLVEDAGGERARLVPCSARGTGTGTNLGLREARHETVLVTHDDCTVAPDWVGTATRLASEDPTAIFTGRVLPAGDPRHVPSTKDDPAPQNYTGKAQRGALYANNMVLNRRFALELGGFDDRVLFAEDDDFCYRWLRAGRRLRYEPVLVVWHHEWRSPAELRRLYRRYYRGQGLMHAKHLRSGDLSVLRFLASDLYQGARGQLAALVRGRPSWTDPRPRVWRGLLPGLVAGWRRFSLRS